MKSLVAACGLLVCGLADAKPVWRPPPPRTDATELAARLVEAIRARDVADVQAMFADRLVHDGLWFADAACAKRFGTKGTIEKAALRALAKCFAQHKLIATTRRSAAGSAILTFDPGVEIVLVFDRDRITYAGGVWPTDADRGKPTLTAQAFEALRIAGSTRLDTVLAGTLAGTASAWIKVCLDASGAVARSVVVESKPAAAGDTFLAAIRDWKFKRFAKGQPACALSLLTYPAASAPAVETLPAPPSLPVNTIIESEIIDLGEFSPHSIGSRGPHTIPPVVLEQHRIKGTRQIDPDAATKRAIAKSPRASAIASHKLCVDAAGAVSSITLLKSSGFADYDAKLEREMRRWAFTPHVVNGKPAPVCTAITFSYRVKP